MICNSRIKYIDSLSKVLLILVASVFSGCQKVINIDLNEASPHIVIEGLITNTGGPFTVKISKSGSYFDQPTLPAVSGAEVVITDDSGTIDTLKEIKPGIYLTSRTRGVPGRTYTLKVLSENLQYNGSSTMQSHVIIDSLRLVKTQSQHFGFGNDDKNDTHIDIHCYFSDPKEKNFYRIRVITNDTVRAGDYRLYDDQYTNGQLTDLRVAHAESGDTTRVELFSLDRGTYEYYRTLGDLLDSNPIFGSTPANPNTNLTNGALGYFGACAVSTKTIIITDSLLKTLK
jgi:hypothetical protein